MKATPGVSSLQPFVERGALAGAVTIVANKSRILAQETVGFADLEARFPMQPDSLFWIASTSKPIAATAFMMLVDEGKVRLDDPVADYLPEFKNLWLTAEQDEAHVVLRRPSRPPTIRHLLSHTSGMPFRSAMEFPQLDMLPLEDMIRSYAISPLAFEPGSKYMYSNTGINTVGRIIELLSGMDFEDYLAERLLQPLGMKDTTVRPSLEQLPRLARTYGPNEAQTALRETVTDFLSYPLNNPARRCFAGGSYFGTAQDLARFGQMILNGGEWKGRRYVSAAAIAEMGRRQTPPELPESYGLGWGVGDGFFGHGGALGTNLTIFPRAGLLTVYMVQHTGYVAEGEKAGEAFRNAALAAFATA